MLDRLKQKTTLKFDKDRLKALCDSIRNDFQKKVVINNELGKWWHWPLSRILLSRIYGKFGRAQRKPSGDDECQFYHPVCNVPWLDGRLVRMKSARQHKAFTMKEFTGKKGWPDLDSSRVLPLYARGSSLRSMALPIIALIAKP
jgi:hypothetical protein